jgi:hypothetical protein
MSEKFISLSYHEAKRDAIEEPDPRGGCRSR